MNTPTSLRLPLSCLLLALLSACGGGSKAPADAAPTATVSGRAVDGPLQGATACYDLDDNGGCDANEPSSAPTDADGAFRINVPLTQAGRHRVVVMVPASAIDKDTAAAVGTAFTLRAPATGSTGDHSVFVSPLTTLVQAHMDRSGATLAEAVELVRSQAALVLSPLADFTAGSSADHLQAALVARLVQLTALNQAADLAAVVGTPDRTGTLITQAQVDAEIASSLIAALPSVAAAALDPALAGASGSSLQATLRLLASALAAQVGLGSEQVLAGATASALAGPPDPAGTGVVAANLNLFRYTDGNNWSYVTRQLSAADNTPDGQNFTRYSDVRVQSASTLLNANGVISSWSGSGLLARAGDLHWSGSAWVNCVITDRFRTKVPDALGRTSYDFCNNQETGNSVRRNVDIGGRSMLLVVRDMIRSFPGASSSFGPANLGLYGSAAFPLASVLRYQTNTVTSSAPSYDAQDSNLVSVYPAAVAAGGDTRVNPTLACNLTPAAAAAVFTPATTLEELVARNPGRPCTFGQAGTGADLSLPANEWSGNSSVNLGDLPGANTLPANTGNHYTTTATLRVSFAASGSRVTFLRCLRRAADNSPRNCSVLGLGTRAIQTLGDARVLSFSVQPALAQKLGYARVFVERGGKVYFGFKSPVGSVSTDIRLNQIAANALLEQLGLPRIRPVTQPGTATGARAATLATLKGAWGGADPSGTEATVFRWGDNGRFFMAEAKPFLPATQEQSGAELGWFDYDPVNKRIASVLEVDSNLSSGTSHPSATEMSAQFDITATALTDAAGNVLLSRLPTAATGIVGLWAFESPTDLSVSHLAFFDNGRAMVITHRADPQCLSGSAPGECPPGVEFAEYSFDAQTGALRVFNLQYDTNGCGGLFNNCPTAVANDNLNFEATSVFTIQPGNQTITFPDGTNTRTLYRVAPL